MNYPFANSIYHVRIVLACALLALAFTFIRGEHDIIESSLLCFIMLCIQLEIILWFASKIFRFKMLITTRGFIRNTLYRLGIFYLGVFIISALSVLLVLSAFFLIKGLNLQTQLQNLFNREFKGFFELFIICLGPSTIIHFYFLWTAALGREQKLREEKLLFQFETLKSQVNPHFLFNSLNTLSSLTGTNPALADLFIQKLSAIYHYVLEYREIESIDLTSEINFVRDYFYLQQIRDEDKIELSIEINDPQKYKILPISLQLLVENALKHNVATREKPLKISIYLEGDSIVVMNNLQRRNTLVYSKKIGLNNLRERVKYSGEKEMKVMETKDEFKVIIPLIL